MRHALIICMKLIIVYNLKMSYYSTYRWCAVPVCKNTSVKTPNKLWIRVPTNLNMRKTWFKLARRDPELLCKKTRLYFCEDHFDLEHDMENYMKYKIMGSVKSVRLKPHCIPTRFSWNRKHKSTSNDSHLVEAKRLRIPQCKGSAQDHIEEDVKTSSSSCIEDNFTNSQTALGVPSIGNKCDKAVEVIQVQEVESKSTEEVLSLKNKGIQACQTAKYRSKQVQIDVKHKNEITSPIKFIVTTLKTSIKNATKPSSMSQSTVLRNLCLIEENCDSDTSCTPSLVGLTVDQDYSPSKASLFKTTTNTSSQLCHIRENRLLTLLMRNFI